MKNISKDSILRLAEALTGRIARAERALAIVDGTQAAGYRLLVSGPTDENEDEIEDVLLELDDEGFDGLRRVLNGLVRRNKRLLGKCVPFLRGIDAPMTECVDS